MREDGVVEQADVIGAVRLALAGRPLTTEARVLDVIEWLMGNEELDAPGAVPLFIAAIEATGDSDG
jgi:hypothetical protein